MSGDIAEDGARPHILLDAGGAASGVLISAIEHLMAALGGGQIIEVISMTPSARADVSDWCEANGHELCSAVRDGERTQFRIRRK